MKQTINKTTMNLTPWRLSTLAALAILALVGFFSYLFIIYNNMRLSSWNWNILPSPCACSSTSRTSNLGERNIPRTFSPNSESESSSLLKESKDIPNQGFLILREATAPARAHRFGVSMFHQLHCLELLRGRIAGNNESEIHHHNHHDHDHAIESQLPSQNYQDDHVQHCLDYLAQVNTPTHPHPQKVKLIRCTRQSSAAQTTPSNPPKASFFPTGRGSISLMARAWCISVTIWRVCGRWCGGRGRHR